MSLSPAAFAQAQHERERLEELLGLSQKKLEELLTSGDDAIEQQVRELQGTIRNVANNIATIQELTGFRVEKFHFIVLETHSS